MAGQEEFARRQRVLSEFGDFVLDHDNVDEILTEACRLIAQALDCDLAKVIEIERDTNKGLVRAGVGWHDGIVGRERISLSERSSEAFAIEKTEPVITNDIGQEKRFEFPPFLHDHGVVALVNVPIFLPGRVPYGILQVDARKPREFNQEDIDFLKTYAMVLGPVVDRLHLAKEREATQAQRAADLAAMEKLQRVSTELVGDRDPKGLYHLIVETAALLMQADAASLQALDPASQQLNLLAWRGFHPNSARFWETVRADSGSSCGHALEAGQRIVVPDTDKFAGEPEDVEAYRRSNLLAVQSTPLKAFSGQVVGMLSTHWRDRHTPSPEDYRYFDMLTRLSADLIERVHAAERLRESEERLRQFGEASQDVLWIRDAETLQWQYLTPAFEAIYGLSREEALSGDNFRNWLDLIVPEDRAHASKAIGRVHRGEHVTFDYRIRRPIDGTVRWLRNTDFPIADGNGRIKLIGGVGHDMTELRETERRLQVLMEGIPQLVWRAAGEGYWTWSSPQWSQYTGVKPDESLGLGWLDALYPDDRDVARQAWAEAARTGRFDAEARICHASEKSYRWFQNRAQPVRDEDDAIVEWLGTSTDVHDMRELQERQQVLVGELQHRTRNLLGVVRSMSDKTVRASADLPDFRTRFRDQLGALARVQSLLSRLDEHDRVTFDELIGAEMAALDSTADRVRIEGPNGVRLRSSTVQTLAMAIHELATNAVKYGALGQPQGKLTITWSLEPNGSDDRPWLHVDWRESGVFMPPASTKPRGGGQGRELIERGLPYQLKAKASFELGPDGVRCTIAIPVSASISDTETVSG